ncbi:MAG TPA: DinB family protein [Candidatus Dormibacteraeota bacterium]|nr:DinB family protein [Candidatus Dormibacteraeota bacterium]
MDQLWIEAFRYHKWANLHLLDVCSKLTPEQLQLTSPGTYGTIAATLQHLVSAEQRYAARLVASEPKLNERDEFPGIATLMELATSGADQLIEAAARIKPDDTIEATFENEPMKLHLGVVIIQALHHGNDHRTHVCTILGSHQVPYGDMDVWAYGDATGAIVPASSG